MRRFVRGAATWLAVAGWALAAPAIAESGGAESGGVESGGAGDPGRGKYVFTISGCVTCHTTKADRKKGVYLAGGRAFKTNFGTFYSPNITPDPEFGIGGWRAEDLIKALTKGVSPAGDHYFPVFPYTSYTRMTDADIRDLWAYLRTMPAVRRANRDHDTIPVFGWRFLLGFWKALYFKPGRLAPEPSRGPAWNRGAYIVEALGHCGECHTPRGILGGAVSPLHLAGAATGPSGEAVPNITPHKQTGIGKWSDGDLDTLLTMGMLPDGDFVGGGMGDVIENIGKLTEFDRRAVIAYLKSLPAIDHRISVQTRRKAAPKANW